MEVMDFPEKLEKLIAHSGMKAAEVARRSGIPPQRFTDWKADRKRRPTADQALHLARALNVSVDYLLDSELDDPPDPVLTTAEREILAFVRRIGIEDAWERLSLKAGTVARPIGGTDLDPSERQPERQDERAKRPRRPR
jgi:transcriptional regulator with XRE-family HTH domain